jgi:hypothetical protein
MKKIIIVILCLLNGLVMAQDNVEKIDSTDKTLFRKPIGWYAAADFEYTKFDKKDVYLGGLSGGVIFDHRFSMGLAFLIALNSPHLKFSDVAPHQDVFLYCSYGGLKMEYILFPTKKVFVKFPVLIGGGGITYETVNHMPGYSKNDYTFASNNFFVFEPGVLVGINIIEYTRLELGSMYRLSSNVQLPNTSSHILYGFNAVVSLKFGQF